MIYLNKVALWDAWSLHSCRTFGLIIVSIGGERLQSGQRPCAQKAEAQYPKSKGPVPSEQRFCTQQAEAL